MPGDSDSSGLLAADQNVAFQHEIADVFETDPALVQLASVLGCDTVDHFRGVECAHHLAGPLLSFEQPAKDDGIDLVRIDETSIFSHRAYAIRVTVGDQASMAALAYNCLLRLSYVWLDWLGIDAGEKR